MIRMKNVNNSKYLVIFIRIALSMDFSEFAKSGEIGPISMEISLHEIKIERLIHINLKNKAKVV